MYTGHPIFHAEINQNLKVETGGEWRTLWCHHGS